MRALFVGLTTLDVIHALDAVPDPALKVTSRDFVTAAGGPATNAAVAAAALERVAAARGEQGGAEADSEVALLSAVGEAPVTGLVRADLAESGVRLLDASREGESCAPAVSSAIEHPEGRMVASTNARLDVDATRAEALLAGHAAGTAGSPALGDERSSGERHDAEATLDVVLWDGHNPELAALALRLGAPEADAEDPFAEIEARPSHLRVLDGGSWKPWLPGLLGFVDVAVVSEDFVPPLVAALRPAPGTAETEEAGTGPGTSNDRADAALGEEVAAFLAGFGVTKVVRTRGPRSVQWWWDGAAGEVKVEAVDGASTLGAGDVFHGAFAWGLGRLHAAGREVGADPTVLVRFAAEVASLSTRSFGTRAWRADEGLAGPVTAFLTAAGLGD